MIRLLTAPPEPNAADARRPPPRRLLIVAGAFAAALIVGACSSDDEVVGEVGDDATLTETTALEIDDTVATTVSEPDAEVIGSIMIEGKVYEFTRIVGDTCRVGDGDAELVVAAQSDPPLDEGGVALTARLDRQDPENDELSVTVGDVVYEAPSFRTIEVETSGGVANGLAEVIPTGGSDDDRVQVTFEVDCTG